LPRFSANLSFLFRELPLADRFNAAASAGFDAVEITFPYGWPAAELAGYAAAAGVEFALFNAPPGDLEAGEFGLAAIAGCEDRFRASFELALDYARILGCRRIHVLAGIAEPADDACAAAYISNLRHAAEAADEGVTVLIEPLSRNTRPGYFLAGFEQAEKAIRAVGQQNLRLQFDIYHRQMMEGDVVAGIRRLHPLVGHFQVASVPGRHEPGKGELDDAFIFAAIDELGYEGLVGAEYHPREDTQSGLEWFAPYRTRA
jgi:hydroxypyruvate isomerase